MSQLENHTQSGRGRLSAIPGHGGPTESRPDSTPVVPAQRLLEIAGALSDGAARVHEQLRHLDPDERDALLDLVTGQIGDIVALWAELVRGVVSPEAATGERLASVADERTVRSDPLPATGGDVRVLPDPPEASPYRRQTPQPPAVTAERDGLTRDELTGVLNRQAGFASLERELERCRQSGARFIVGYLNVDGLRHVNEAHGPRAGDELLRKVTSALRATLRSYDVILRLGGDEFLFSLPGADMATAEQRLKEFRVILAEEAPGGSASVGFAELRRGDCLDELIARADASLRQSRRPGRRHN